MVYVIRFESESGLSCHGNRADISVGMHARAYTAFKSQKLTNESSSNCVGWRRRGSVPYLGIPVWRVVITTFSAMRWLHHPFLCLLGRCFKIWHRKFRMRKKLTARAIWGFEITMGYQKIKMLEFKKRGQIGCKCRADFKSGLRI